MSITEELNILSKMTGVVNHEEKIEITDKEIIEKYYYQVVSKRFFNNEDCDIKNITDLYRDKKEWESTIQQIFKVDTPLTSSDIIKFGEELLNTKKDIIFLKEIITKLDRSKLGYVDGGDKDDCRDITSQFAIDTKETLFCEWVKNPYRVNSVVSAGPEYYGRYPSAKTEYQLKATDSNYGSRILRKQIYQDQTYDLPSANIGEKKIDGKYQTVYFWKTGYGSNIETILNIIWNNERKQRNTGIYKSVDPIYITDIEIKQYLDKWVKDGKVIKPRHQIYSYYDQILLYMKRKKIIKVSSVNGKNYIEALITKLEYDLKFTTIDDFNVVSDKDKYLPMQYDVEREKHPRIGIVMNGSHPQLYYKEITFSKESEWEEQYDSEEKETKSVLKESGIPFFGSSQLSPTPSIFNRIVDYDKSKRFTYSPSWGEYVKGLFLNHLKDGKVKTCVKTTTVTKFNKETRTVEKVFHENGQEKRRYTSQAYKFYQMHINDFLELETQNKRFKVVASANTTKEDFKKLGIRFKKRTTSISSIEETDSLCFEFNQTIPSSKIKQLLKKLQKADFVEKAELVVPKILIFTDISQKPFYERVTAKS